MAREMCNGSLSGAAIESTEIAFRPGNLKSGKFEADTQTAGYTRIVNAIWNPVKLQC